MLIFLKNLLWTVDFNKQLNSNRSDMRFFAFSLTKDLVQDTLLKAIRYAKKYKEDTNFRGWLHTIMKNTFINNYKRAVRIRAHILVTEEIFCSQLLNNSISNASSGNFVMEDIRKALEKLSPQYAIPFIKYFEGFKYHEIANMLHIPIGTVKTRIHIARYVLKKSLKMYKQGFSAVG